MFELITSCLAAVTENTLISNKLLDISWFRLILFWITIDTFVDIPSALLVTLEILCINFFFQSFRDTESFLVCHLIQLTELVYLSRNRYSLLSNHRSSHRQDHVSLASFHPYTPTRYVLATTLPLFPLLGSRRQP